MTQTDDKPRGTCGLVPPTDDCPNWSGEVADDLCATCWYVEYLESIEAQIDDDDNLDDCVDADYDDWSCSKCGGTVGHRINCPDGIAFSDPAT